MPVRGPHREDWPALQAVPVVGRGRIYIATGLEVGVPSHVCDLADNPAQSTPCPTLDDWQDTSLDPRMGPRCSVPEAVLRPPSPHRLCAKGFAAGTINRSSLSSSSS